VVVTIGWSKAYSSATVVVFARKPDDSAGGLSGRCEEPQTVVIAPVPASARERAASEGTRRFSGECPQRNTLCLCLRAGGIEVNIRTAVILSGVVISVGAGPHLEASSPRLHVRVYPTVSSAPADILVSVGFARHADNRVLRVSAESEDFFRSSEVQLDGEESPSVSSFMFRQMPAGEYSLSAVLIGSNGRAREVERLMFVVT
jgi:hypothetical protein